ncbi:MAG: hypothetical protein WCV56_03310, partial [Candidatus Omnitrophota bacterium]
MSLIERIKYKVIDFLHIAGRCVMRPSFQQIERELERHLNMIRLMADNEFKARAMMKRLQGRPINVLFVCHEPTLWGMFESVYQAMAGDSGFAPNIVTLPYEHPTFSAGEYKDAGMAEFLEQKGVTVVRGYDKETQKWISPATLRPDYVFFQTPYSFFPPEWCVDQVSLIARVCFIPYGMCLFKGDVDKCVHPLSFFRSAHLIFKEGQILRDMFVEKFKQYEWFNERNTIVSGHPKLD